jgi:hypothetical protein
MVFTMPALLFAVQKSVPPTTVDSYGQCDQGHRYLLPISGWRICRKE